MEVPRSGKVIGKGGLDVSIETQWGSNLTSGFS